MKTFLINMMMIVAAVYFMFVAVDYSHMREMQKENLRLSMRLLELQIEELEGGES